MADITKWKCSSTHGTHLSPSNPLRSMQCGADLAPWAACWRCNKWGNYRHCSAPTRHHSDYKACNHIEGMSEKQLPGRPLAPYSPASWSNGGFVTGFQWRFGRNRIKLSVLVLECTPSVTVSLSNCQLRTKDANASRWITSWLVFLCEATEWKIRSLLNMFSWIRAGECLLCVTAPQAGFHTLCPEWSTLASPHLHISLPAWMFWQFSSKVILHKHLQS